ncbi:MAG: hypothetical protein ACI857_003280 [Arenicella sp.]|jgi:hypothetical protein
MKQKVLSALFISIPAFVGYVILRAGLAHNNTAFIISGIIIMAVALVMGIVFFLILKKRSNKNQKKYLADLNAFKNSSRKTRINLDDIEVNVGLWRRDEYIESERLSLFEYPFGLDEIEESESYRGTGIAINFEHKGNKEVYKTNVPFEDDVVRMKFMLKKETILYISNNEIYLDLEFLFNESGR